MILRAMNIVRKVVPDLEKRIGQFDVESFEVDEGLVSLFCDELEELVREMQQGVETSDDEKTRFAAHSIKGMAGLMGVPEISVLAHEIEMTIQGGQKERCRILVSALVSWSRPFIIRARSDGAAG